MGLSLTKLYFPVDLYDQPPYKEQRNERGKQQEVMARLFQCTFQCHLQQHTSVTKNNRNRLGYEKQYQKTQLGKLL